MMTEVNRYKDVQNIDQRQEVNINWIDTDRKRSEDEMIMKWIMIMGIEKESA